MTYRYDRRRVQRAIREAGGSAAVAAKLGVARNSVRYWEKGVGDPSAGNLAKLATLTGVEPAEFFPLVVRP